MRRINIPKIKCFLLNGQLMCRAHTHSLILKVLKKESGAERITHIHTHDSCIELRVDIVFSLTLCAGFMLMDIIGIFSKHLYEEIKLCIRTNVFPLTIYNVQFAR